MSDYINPIKIIVLITTLHGMRCLSFKDPIQKILLWILIICSAVEIVNSVIAIFAGHISISMTIGVLFHHSLWIILWGKVTNNQALANKVTTGFIVFLMANLIFYEGIEYFNYYSFVMGSFLYLLLFVYGNIKLLYSENIDGFLSNNFLLLFVPVIMFFGLSFMFAFKTSDLTHAPFYSNFSLYDFIINYVNLIYYGLLNLYIYKEKHPLWLQT